MYWNRSKEKEVDLKRLDGAIDLLIEKRQKPRSILLVSLIFVLLWLYLLWQYFFIDQFHKCHWSLFYFGFTYYDNIFLYICFTSLLFHFDPRKSYYSIVSPREKTFMEKVEYFELKSGKFVWNFLEISCKK